MGNYLNKLLILLVFHSHFIAYVIGVCAAQLNNRDRPRTMFTPLALLHSCQLNDRPCRHVHASAAKLNDRPYSHLWLCRIAQRMSTPLPHSSTYNDRCSVII